MNFIIYFLALISLFTFEINADRDFTRNLRDSYNRYDPDSILSGFFPFWGAVLLILSGCFLVMIAFSLVGYLIGCRSPPESHQSSIDSTTPFYVKQNFSINI